MEERQSFARGVGWTRGSFTVLLGLLLVAATVGCAPKSRAETAEVPVVPVSHPVEQVVTDYVDFTGRTNAVDSVNIIARVTGYLGKPLFEEGSEVKEGETLFVIDPRPYQAQLEQAQRQVVLSEAQSKLAKTTLDRYEALSKTTPGAVSEQALDQYKAAVAEAEARVDAQKSSLKLNELNKEFTQVVSPIDGLVSRYYQTRGNLVNQDQTLLTTVVSLDPMYVDFDMDESTLLKIRTAIKEGKMTVPADGHLQVRMGLQNEEGRFPHEATIIFMDNQVNSTIGSIPVRGFFRNPKQIPATKGPGAAGAAGTPPANGYPVSTAVGPGAVGAKAPSAEKASLPGVTSTIKFDRLFSPGMFVRIQLPMGEPHKALLIIDRAILSNQGLKYVYVVDAQNKVQNRSVKTGALQEDGRRVVEGDVKPDDWVVVGALQQVREQMEVRPEQRPMPSLAGQSDAAPPTSGAKGTATK